VDVARKHNPEFPHRKKLSDNLPDHDGETYEPGLDKPRLNKQTRRVFDVMADRRWHTLREIANVTGDPEASISARIRDLRKPKFGEFVIDRDRDDNGLFYYKLKDKPDGQKNAY
jgi:hypothetical protein